MLLLHSHFNHQCDLIFGKMINKNLFRVLYIDLYTPTSSPCMVLLETSPTSFLGEVHFFFSGLMAGPTYRPPVRHSNPDTATPLGCSSRFVTLKDVTTGSCTTLIRWTQVELYHAFDSWKLLQNQPNPSSKLAKLCMGYVQRRWWSTLLSACRGNGVARKLAVISRRKPRSSYHFPRSASV